MIKKDSKPLLKKKWDPESFFEASAYEEAQRSGWHNVIKKIKHRLKKNYGIINKSNL